MKVRYCIGKKWAAAGHVFHVLYHRVFIIINKAADTGTITPAFRKTNLKPFLVDQRDWTLELVIAPCQLASCLLYTAIGTLSSQPRA